MTDNEKAVELRAYEKVRAELAAEAMTAGEQTGCCETCASFDMTGWSMDTVNEVIDRLRGRVLGHTYGKEGCFCRPTIKGKVKAHDLSARLTAGTEPEKP